MNEACSGRGEFPHAAVINTSLILQLRGDASKSVKFYSGARHKKYHGVDAARLAFYLDNPRRSKPERGSEPKREADTVRIVRISCDNLF